jgi:HlyD family secretion protein
MDIKRQLDKKPLWRRFWYVLPLCLALLAVGWFFNRLSHASLLVDKDTIVTALVEQGRFVVNVSAVGVLKPSEIRWVSTLVAGKVEQVLIKPGTPVTKGQTLIQLSNPELAQELDKTRWEESATAASQHAELVSLESTLVDLDNAVIAAEYDYQAAKLKLDAEAQLMALGNATVSRLDYQRTQLAVKQQQQYWQAQAQKAEKMRARIDATQIAHAAKLGQIQSHLQRIQSQVEALAVKAERDGVVQQVSLQLGEQAPLGSSAVLVADQHHLYALLRVPEAKIQDIVLGQTVQVETRNSRIQGKVSRIDPVVNNGMVEIDVVLSGSLPQEARPELSVNALVEISNIDSALYVKRPMFAPNNSTISVYKLSAGKQYADRVNVTLGQTSAYTIEVITGLSAGDEVVISDTNDWQDHKRILLN